MDKWYQQPEQAGQNILCSRVRLTRNFRDWVFPSKLSEAEGARLVRELGRTAEELRLSDGSGLALLELSGVSDLDRRVFRDRKLLNTSLAEKKGAMALAYSEDEAVSLVMNGTDHLRIQVLSRGTGLMEDYETAEAIDDFFNARYAYAFDDKYGYLTSFPTNVGTGLRASVIVHLPALSQGKRFSAMIQDMGRFGVTVRGVLGEGEENAGSLFEVSNQKTMGQTERELLILVSQVAAQLSAQENQMRKRMISECRLLREDEAYKAYGLLKYARSLTMKEAMTYLSRLLSGISDGLIALAEPCSLYGLMLRIQPAGLQKAATHPLGKEEIHMARAGLIRRELPGLTEISSGGKTA